MIWQIIILALALAALAVMASGGVRVKTSVDVQVGGKRWIKRKVETDELP